MIGGFSNACKRIFSIVLHGVLMYTAILSRYHFDYGSMASPGPGRRPNASEASVVTLTLAAEPFRDLLVGANLNAYQYDFVSSSERTLPIHKISKGEMPLRIGLDVVRLDQSSYTKGSEDSDKFTTYTVYANWYF